MDRILFNRHNLDTFPCIQCRMVWFCFEYQCIIYSSELDSNAKLYILHINKEVGTHSCARYVASAVVWKEKGSIERRNRQRWRMKWERFITMKKKAPNSHKVECTIKMNDIAWYYMVLYSCWPFTMNFHLFYRCVFSLVCTLGCCYTILFLLSIWFKLI